jgi:hypothetical protein
MYGKKRRIRFVLFYEFAIREINVTIMTAWIVSPRGFAMTERLRVCNDGDMRHVTSEGAA